MFISGRRCRSAASLERSERDICEKLLTDSWRIECTSIISYDYYYYYYHDQCDLLCESFARCFNETGNQPWIDQCSSKFRRSSFLITANSKYEASSSVISIRGRRCKPFRQNVYVVSVSRCNCSVDDYESGM